MGLTANQYFEEMKALLPRGVFWEIEDGDVLSNLLGALSEEFARIDARALGLLDEVDPRTVYELLADSERDLGLPDSCTDQVDTLAERRDALHSKLISVGGQSRQYFISLAQALGYSITISEFRSFVAGGGAAGGALTNSQWSHAWQANAAAETIREFVVGSAAGESLRDWGNESLECVLNKYKPAHTTVLFAYG